MRRAFLLFTLVVALPALAQADFYMKTKITTSGIAGLGGTEGKTESWISGKKHVEMTEIKVTSPLMKPFMDGTETYTVTDLDKGLITEINKKEKTYTQLSFEDMRAQVKAAQQQAQETYAEAKKDMQKPMPTVEGGEIKVETQSTGEKKKIAGLQSERTKLIMRSTGTDENGEEVTFKVVYDAWLTPELPGSAEREAYMNAYAESFQMNLEDELLEGDMSLQTALASSGIGAEALAPHLEALQGYPTLMTVSLGTELTEEQREEMAEAMKEQEKETKKGGGFSLGGLTKKIEKAVGDKITDAMVNEFFGQGVSVDEDGDPVFFTMTSELEKVSTKSDPKKFKIPEDYTKIN